MTFPSRPRVALVIPTADRRVGHAAKSIPLAERTTAHLDVDLQVVESSGPDFRFSRSINTGIARAPDADAWVLLNDDAFMDEGWLDAMLDAARAHPEVGVVGAVLRYPHGGLQHAGGRIPLTPVEYVRASLRHRAPFWALRNLREHRFAKRAYMFDHYAKVDPRHRLDFVTGACYLITRACFEKVGGMDERYLFGSEDVDHSLRTLEAGFEIALATRATGVHIDGGSGVHGSPKAQASIRAFHERWSGDAIWRVTRRDGRRGIHHGGAA